MEMNNHRLDRAVLGAICGDVAGSIYEWHNIKYRLPEDRLIIGRSRFTDDTVMTCAVAKGLIQGLRELPRDWWNHPQGRAILLAHVRDQVLEHGLRYPEAGYGSSFIRWLKSADHAPYNSWGNGSAMRASYPGWLADSLEEAEELAAISAEVTHNHPEGVKGAKAVAGSIFLLRQGKTKQEVADYVGRYYDLNFTMDGIRDSYQFDVSCAGSVPQGIKAFLETETFADALSLAISIGGDSDTLAAVAGSLAEVIYPIPEELRRKTLEKLDDNMKTTLCDAVDFLEDRGISLPAVTV